MTGTAQAGLGGGLGDAAQDSQDQEAVAVLTASVLAYGSAMAASDWPRAGVYLTFFQSFWNDYSYRAKRYGTAHGFSAAALATAPNALAIDGAWGPHTHDAVLLTLTLFYGPAAARPALASAPSSAGAVALWFNTNVAPLEPPTSALWGMWTTTRTTSMSSMIDAVSTWFDTYHAAGRPSPSTPTTTTPPPDTSPGAGTAPVPTQLPTTPRRVDITDPTLITGSSAKVPTWVWVAAGGVAIGAVVGVGYYVVKNRPDLFRSRRKKRRR